MSKKYSRSDLIQQVYEGQGPEDKGNYATKATVEKIIKSALELIADNVRAGRDVELKGFATFKPVDRPARTGRNPQTGEPVQIPARRACAIKAKFKMQPGE